MSFFDDPSDLYGNTTESTTVSNHEGGNPYGDPYGADPFSDPYSMNEGEEDEERKKREEGDNNNSEKNGEQNDNPFLVEVEGEENEEDGEEEEEEEGPEDIDIDFNNVFGEDNEHYHGDADHLEYHDAKDNNGQEKDLPEEAEIFYVSDEQDLVCMNLPDETCVTYNHTLKELEFKTDIGTFLTTTFVPPDPRKTSSLPSPRDTRDSMLSEETIFGNKSFANKSRKKVQSIIVEEDKVPDGAGVVSQEDGQKDENFLSSTSIKEGEKTDKEPQVKRSLIERLAEHEKHGHMIKLGAVKHKILGDSWKKRYFELKQGMMTYREEKGKPVIKSIYLHGLCTISRKQATDDARKDRYDLKEFHEATNTPTSPTSPRSTSASIDGVSTKKEDLTLADYANLDEVLEATKSNTKYLGKVGRDHTLELHVPLTSGQINNRMLFNRTYYIQCEDSAEEAAWYETIRATIQVYRDIDQEHLQEEMDAKTAQYEQECKDQVEKELKSQQLQEGIQSLSLEDQEKQRKQREEELVKEARRAAKKPVDVNALIRKSNHPDMSVLYYKTLLYSDMTEDELLPYIYLFYDKVKTVCQLEEF